MFFNSDIERTHMIIARASRWVDILHTENQLTEDSAQFLFDLLVDLLDGMGDRELNILLAKKGESDGTSKSTTIPK